MSELALDTVVTTTERGQEPSLRQILERLSTLHIDLQAALHGEIAHRMEGQDGAGYRFARYLGKMAAEASKSSSNLI